MVYAKVRLFMRGKLYITSKSLALSYDFPEHSYIDWIFIVFLKEKLFENRVDRTRLKAFQGPLGPHVFIWTLSREKNPVLEAVTPLSFA